MSQVFLILRRSGQLYIPAMTPELLRLGVWVKQARTKAGLTQEALGELLGVTKGNVSGWETARHQPGVSQVMEISRITGHPPPFVSGVMNAQEGTGTPSTFQPILAWEFPDDLPEGEFVMVPKLDVKLSAGNGHEQLEINLTRSTPLAFRASWVREKRLKPGKLAAMTATGDSMQPGIFDGDSLVVDTSQTEVQDGKVYALWYDGGERVKRLYRLPGGGLRIKSDNPDHPPIEVQPEKLEHVRILGRVVHRSGDGGL